MNYEGDVCFARGVGGLRSVMLGANLQFNVVPPTSCAYLLCLPLVPTSCAYLPLVPIYLLFKLALLLDD